MSRGTPLEEWRLRRTQRGTAVRGGPGVPSLARQVLPAPLLIPGRGSLVRVSLVQVVGGPIPPPPPPLGFGPQLRRRDPETCKAGEAVYVYHVDIHK